MPRKKVILTVEVELDDIPGAFHTPESALEIIQIRLTQMIPHYYPRVRIQKD